MLTLAPLQIDEERLATAIGAVALDFAGNNLVWGDPVAPPAAGSEVARDAARPGRLADLSRWLTRTANRAAMAAPNIAEMHTSVTCIRVEPRLAQALSALLAELIHASIEFGEPDLTLYFAAGWEEDRLLLGLAFPQTTPAPAPTARSARCMMRATALASALGGELVRGVKDGMMVFGASFDWQVL